MNVVAFKHTQTNKLKIQIQKGLGGAKGGVFREQNVHLEAGIEFDNGVLHHVASKTFLTSINNQKGRGG